MSRTQRIAMVQRGPANAGKTSTIRLFHELLLKAFPGATESGRTTGRRDYRAVVTIGSVRIGIETLGDPSNRRQAESLRLFVEQGCAVIVTASRTRGDTVGVVGELEDDGYQVHWRERSREAESDRARANRREADWMLDRARALIDAAGK